MIIRSFRVVRFEDIDKKNYFTISACGVTHYTNEMVFTKLTDWEQEYTIFVKLTDVSSLFSHKSNAVIVIVAVTLA